MGPLVIAGSRSHDRVIFLIHTSRQESRLARKTPGPTNFGPTGSWDVYVRVEDVAAEEAALRAPGVEIVKGPDDTFYEMREIEILDPDGYRWCFGQDLSS